MSSTPTSLCPPLEDLEQIAAGQSPEPSVCDHVAQCPACSEYLAELKNNNELLAEIQAADSKGSASGLSDQANIRIPGYELIREVHRGGQGVVYQAIQSSTGRSVALKTMRGGRLASVDDRARFDREIHVLSRLRHPNIVTIHDSGTFGGMDYFVMDYIDGLPLDDYVESRSRTAVAAETASPAPVNVASRKSDAARFDRPITIREKMAVFASICDALNAAHLHGIVHRDLKPSNIRIDAEGQPHLLDFGLAKLVTGDSDATAMTITGQFVGSLPWAAPEQAEGTPAKIDIRTDVYAVGVMLYQMLTGKFPYSVLGPMREVTQRILTAEPVQPRSLNRGIDDEVETIVLKCLQKDRERRYQSAGELARDIRRYLAGEPIEAKRDSGWYLLTKMLDRHKVTVAVVAAFVAITAGSAIALAFMYHNQSQARALAVTEATNARIAKENETVQRKAAEQAREEAEHNLNAAEEESARANAITSLLRRILVPEQPEAARPPEYTFRELLDDAVLKIPMELKDQPEVEAAIRYTIGAAYHGISEYGKSKHNLQLAQQLLEKLYGREGKELSHVLVYQAMSELQLGEIDAAEIHCREGIELRRGVAETDDLFTANSLDALAEILRSKGKLVEAEEAARESVRVAQAAFGDEHITYGNSLNSLALVLQDAGRYAEAEPPTRKSLEIRRKHLGAENPGVARTMNILAALLQARGEYDEAEAIARRALEIQRRTLGDEHGDLAMTLNTLAVTLRIKNDLAGAEPLYREALAIARKAHGDVHPNVASTLQNLGLVLHYQGKYDEAEPLYLEALAQERRLYGDDHPDIARVINSLGGLRDVKGDYDGAEKLYRESLEMRLRLVGEQHPDVATGLINLASVVAKRGQYNKSSALYRRALEICRRVLSPEHRNTLSAMCGLGFVLLQQEEFAEAEPLLRECLAQRERQAPEEWGRFNAMSLLGACLAGQQQFEEAEPLLLGGFEGLDRLADAPDDKKQNALRRLINFYETTDRPDEVSRWQNRAAAVEEASANDAAQAERLRN